MPRLIGKTSKTPLYLIITLLVVAAIAAQLEDMGTIDVVPGFGRENPDRRVPDTQYPRPLRPMAS